jgi:hypothetical protein
MKRSGPLSRAELGWMAVEAMIVIMIDSYVSVL